MIRKALSTLSLLIFIVFLLNLRKMNLLISVTLFLLLSLIFFFPQLDIVCDSLKQLKDTDTADLDRTPSFLLRDCATVFANLLQYMFNLTIKTSTFPKLWKIFKFVQYLKRAIHLLQQVIEQYHCFLTFLGVRDDLFQILIFRYQYVHNVTSACQVDRI